jgi:hypothetical protein
LLSLSRERIKTEILERERETPTLFSFLLEWAKVLIFYGRESGGEYDSAVKVSKLIITLC